MIEKAADVAQYKRHQRTNGESDNRSTASESASAVAIARANVNVMKTSAYQSDPLAATMHTRSIGLAKLSASKLERAVDKELFTQTLKIKGNRLTDSGMKIDML